MNILATSGGFTSDGRYGFKVGALLNYALTLAEPFVDRPRVCLINTASGDDDRYYRLEYAALNRDRTDVIVSHVALFPQPNIEDIRQHLLKQDVIWVGGGSVANLLALWRLHGLDAYLREAWETGVVLGGVSAGSLCWHVGGTTDSFGPDLKPVTNGLGFLPHSNTPHYDSEEQRRPTYEGLVAQGILPAGWATDDGVGVHFRGTEFVEAVSEKPDVYAWHVEAKGNQAVETRIKPRLLTE